MKLHLGCGMSKLDGWVNCDLTPGPCVDTVFDVEHTWPFPDNSAEYIYGSHMLEHLTHPMRFFAEAWRVLREPSEMLLRLPYGGHKAAWWDLTHIRPWYPENFCILQPGYAAAVGNPQHTDVAYPFGIRIVQQRVTGRLARYLRWRIGRRILVPWLELLTNSIEELWVYLYPLKSPQSEQLFHENRPAGNVVPVEFVMYEHQIRNRTLPPGAGAHLISLDAGHERINGFYG